MEIGTYIREKREQQGVSQEAVAYRLGMSQAAYSKIERNETQVKAIQVYKIAACLNMSVYELLPPSVASDITGENIFGLAWHYIKVFFRKLRQS